MKKAANPTGSGRPRRSPFSIARAVSRKLGLVPSLIWASVYLVCIPGFAVFYALLPEGSWYYGTIVHDARYIRDKKSFGDLIEKWAKQTIEPRLYPALKKAGIDTPSKITYYASYEEDEFWPSILVSLEYLGDRKSTGLSFYLGGMIHGKFIKDLRTSPPTLTEEYSEGYDLTADCKNDKEECLAKTVQQALAPDNYFIGWHGVVDGRRRLFVERKGISVGRTFDTLGRMLYLSAVTITTVGYGDIVPLTDVSRAAVASEAITGIVLIGLFLNALSHERNH